MPMYPLRCPEGHEFEGITIGKEHFSTCLCPACGKAGGEIVWTKMTLTTERRFSGEAQESLLESFHPDEVEEARRLFPDTKIRDDGTVIWTKRSDIDAFNKRRKSMHDEKVKRLEDAGIERPSTVEVVDAPDDGD